MPARRSCEKADLTPVMGHPGHRGGRTVRLVRARTRRLWTDSVGPARDSLPTLALRASRCALRAICESDGQPRPRTRIGDLPWPTISCVRTRHRHRQWLRRREAGEPDDAAGTLWNHGRFERYARGRQVSGRHESWSVGRPRAGPCQRRQRRPCSPGSGCRRAVRGERRHGHLHDMGGVTYGGVAPGSSRTRSQVRALVRR